MPVRTLTAYPLVDGSDTTLFIPGPTAYPALYPVAGVIEALTATAITLVAGTFPGSTEYPGSDEYPGRGSTLVADILPPKILTGVAL